MVLNLTVVRTIDATWLFTWTAGTPDYEIWLNGILLDTVSVEIYEYILPGFDVIPPPLEIVEVSDIPESKIHPPFLILQWREIVLASSYSVEFFVGPLHEKRQFVVARETGYLSYQTIAQEDVTEVRWRIRAMDIFDNFGEEVPFKVDIVKNPDPPDVDITFSGGAVQVGAA